MADFCQDLQNRFNTITNSIQAINTASEENAQGISSAAGSASDMAVEMQAISGEADGVNQVSNDLSAEINKFKV